MNMTLYITSLCAIVSILLSQQCVAISTMDCDSWTAGGRADCTADNDPYCLQNGTVVLGTCSALEVVCGKNVELATDPSTCEATMMELARNILDNPISDPTTDRLPDSTDSASSDSTTMRPADSTNSASSDSTTIRPADSTNSASSDSTVSTNNPLDSKAATMTSLSTCCLLASLLAGLVGPLQLFLNYQRSERAA